MSLCSFMAYDGAGIFVSGPLLNQTNTVYDQCKAIKHTEDHRIAQGIYLHAIMKWSSETALHRIHLHGDHPGFYEAVIVHNQSLCICSDAYLQW